ncbi:Hsp20 family protein [Paracoccus rhizosphaerae]|uniref:Hsp20 family protein n=1 Tax=Paracoccus rhizosphaerae TaxID=1133347 RepID=A0ABV6CG11_9RHOB|nr:Hsp20 family protein [Paracoccus rhizosphaerae]
MRTTFDFAPLFRSSVGFDRLLDALETTSRFNTAQSWPPYDIVKAAEDSYRITVAVAGFNDAEVSITQERNNLIVAGQKAEGDEFEYLHRGIPAARFERRFELADHVQVEEASLRDGLLTISLKREIPEAMKPRQIKIASDAPVERKQLQSSKAAEKVAETTSEPVAA